MLKAVLGMLALVAVGYGQDGQDVGEGKAEELLNNLLKIKQRLQKLDQKVENQLEQIDNNTRKSEQFHA